MATTGARPSPEEAVRLYETMLLIRRTEERLRDDAAAGKLPGLHHMAYLVEDFDAQLAAIRATDPSAGLLIDGTGPGNPVRWCYLDSGGPARGTVIELLERTPRAEALFGGVLGLVS